MRTVTVALLMGAYLCLAFLAAVWLWRSTGGWAVGVAALIGGLGLAVAVHGLVLREPSIPAASGAKSPPCAKPT